MQSSISPAGVNDRATEAPKIPLQVDDVQELMSLLHDLDEPEAEGVSKSSPERAQPQLPYVPMPLASRSEIYRTLLLRDDNQFIRSVYLLLLGRLPDEGGRHTAHELLQRQRMSRIEFLTHIQSSEEASLKRVRLSLSGPELKLARSLERLLRNLLGFFFRPAISADSVSSSPQQSADDRLSDSIDTLTRNSSLLAKAVGYLTDSSRSLQKDHDRAVQELQQLSLTTTELRDSVRELQSLRETLKASVEEQRKQQQQFEKSLREQESRQAFIERKVLALHAVSQQIGGNRERGAETPPVSAQTDQSNVDVARYYFEFENAFRGEESMIKDRVRFYLNVIDPQLGPVLDLGCGRGEWLEVLKESDVKGYGIDSNETSFMRCIGKGLDVKLGDGLKHLRSLPDNSLGAITALHVVEHMPWEVVLELINEAHRVLMPGGTLILETPNPENVLVGSCYFYHDPTHKNPIVPSVLHFTVKYFGFEGVEILRFRPTDFLNTIDAQEWAQPLLHAFNASQDFAVVGRKG